MTTEYRRRLQAHYAVTFFEAFLGVHASLTLLRALLLAPEDR